MKKLLTANATLLFCIGSFIAAAFWKINVNSFWYDEMGTLSYYNPTDNSLSQVIHTSFKDLFPPLYNVLLWFWMSVLGISQTTGRSLSILFGALSIFYFYRYVTLKYGQSVGELSTILMSTNLFILAQSITMRPYTCMLFFTLWSLYEFESFKIKPNNATRVFLSVTGALYAHFWSVFVIFYLFIQSLFLLKSKAHARQMKILLFAVALATAPVAINSYFIIYEYLIEKRKWGWLAYQVKPLHDSVPILLKYWFGHALVGFAAVLLFLIGFLNKLYQKDLKSIVDHSYFVTMMILYFSIHALVQPMLLDRYLLPLFPFLIAGVATTADKLVDKKILAIICFAILFSFRNNQFYEERGYYRETLQELSSVAESAPVLIFSCHKNGFRRYADALHLNINFVDQLPTEWSGNFFVIHDLKKQNIQSLYDASLSTKMYYKGSSGFIELPISQYNSFLDLNNQFPCFSKRFLNVFN